MWPCKNSIWLLLLGTDRSTFVTANFYHFFRPGQDVGRDRQYFALCHAHDEGSIWRDFHQSIIKYHQISSYIIIYHQYNNITEYRFYTASLVGMPCRLCRVVPQYLVKASVQSFQVLNGHTSTGRVRDFISIKTMSPRHCISERMDVLPSWFHHIPQGYKR